MVYICIPAYNEERTIGVVLWKIRQVMAEFGRDYQVLLVDDASTDGTADVIEPYTRIMPIYTRRNDRRAGYAAAVESMVRAAVERSSYHKRDALVTIQADFTDEPDDVVTLVKRIEGGADVVTGEVRITGKGLPPGLRWSRRIWDMVLRRGAREGSGDMLSGFRAYRLMTLAKMLEAAGDGPLLTTDGLAANAELLRKALPFARRAEAVEVEIRYGRRHRPSRFRALQTSRDLARLLLRRKGGRASSAA